MSVRQQRDEYSALGKAILQKIFRQEGYEFNDKAVKNIIGQFKQNDVEDLYAGIGLGTPTAKDVFNAIFPAHKSKHDDAPKTVDDLINKPIDRKEKRQTDRHSGSYSQVWLSIMRGAVIPCLAIVL